MDKININWGRESSTVHSGACQIHHDSFMLYPPGVSELQQFLLMFVADAQMNAEN